jgi:PDZ domain-containing protein GIPC
VLWLYDASAVRFLLLSSTAQSIWETGCHVTNPSDFASAMENSDLNKFAAESFVFDLWGAITDAKQGRLKQSQEFNEQF